MHFGARVLILDERTTPIPVGDRFLVVNRGRSMGRFAQADISREELTRLMAGGAAIDALSHELERPGS